MSKGLSGHFNGTSGYKAAAGSNSGKLKSGHDYNHARSKSVKKVNSKTTLNDSHNMPAKGAPDSVTQNYKNGKLNSERYYDKNGNAYLDIDYTNHGNSKMHPDVPHEHGISIVNGKIKRKNPPKGGINK